MHRFCGWGILVALVTSVLCGRGYAAITGMQSVAGGLASPIFVTHAPNDRDRLFIVERGSPSENTNATASIRILNLNTGILNPTPFLTITGIDDRGEGGLLGMAFHPDYQSNGKLYVYVTAGDSDGSTFFSSYIRQYTVTANPDIADGSTFTPVLNWGQPQSNHNAGWIGFSPNDGYLYISSGDGGGGDDNDAGHTAGTGNGQDITNNFLGKMLRVDVNGDDFTEMTPEGMAKNYAIPHGANRNPFAKIDPDDPDEPDPVGDDEIWAYGLRNPFRDSFDRLTGDLWIGDVGQNTREEVDFQPANWPGGANYGWRLREGTIATPSGGVGGNRPPGNVEPVYDYDRDADQFGGTVIIGGYVYRGPDPSLQGKYFFLDSRNDGNTANDNYWMATANPFGAVTNVDSLLNTSGAQFPVSFGEDAKGNLYIAYIGSGQVVRIVTDQLLAGDYDADGDVDEDDYDVWKTDFGTTNPAADGNGDGTVDASDYTVWRDNLGNSVDNLGAGGGGITVPEPAAIVLFAQVLGLTLLTPRRRGRL